MESVFTLSGYISWRSETYRYCLSMLIEDVQVMHCITCNLSAASRGLSRGEGVDVSSEVRWYRDMEIWRCTLLYIYPRVRVVGKRVTLQNMGYRFMDLFRGTMF